MPQTEKFLLIRRERFRDFLFKLVGAAAADATLKQFESTVETIEIKSGDRLVKFSDVQDALNGVRS